MAKRNANVVFDFDQTIFFFKILDAWPQLLAHVDAIYISETKSP